MKDHDLAMLLLTSYEALDDNKIQCIIYIISNGCYTCVHIVIQYTHIL